MRIQKEMKDVQKVLKQIKQEKNKINSINYHNMINKPQSVFRTKMKNMQLMKKIKNSHEKHLRSILY